MADITLDFSSDISKSLSSITQLRTELKAVADENEKIKKTTREYFQEGVSGVEQFNAEMSKYLKLANDQKTIIDQLTKKIAQLEEAQKKAYNSDDASKYTQKIKELESEIYKLKTQVLELDKNAATAGNGMTTLSTTTGKFAPIISSITTAVKGFFASFGLVAMVTVGLQKLKEYFERVLDPTTRLTAAQKIQKEVMAKASEAYAEQAVKMERLTNLVKQGGLSFQQKQSVLKDYNKTFGDTIGKAKDFADAENKILNLGPAYIQMIKLKAVATAAFQLAVENVKNALVLQQKNELEFLTNGDKAKFALKGMVNNNKAVADEMLVIARKRKSDAIKEETDKNTELFRIQDRANAKAENIQKNFNNIESVNSKNHSSRQISERKDTVDKLIELEKQLAKAKIDAMTEGISKDVADENNTYSNNIADLEAQKAEAKNKKVTDLINKNIEQEKVNHLIRLVAIQTKYYDDAEKAYTDAQNSIDEVKLTDQKQELDAVEKHYEEIANKIKEAKKKAEEYNKNPLGGAIDTSAFDDQQKAIEEKKSKEIAAINLKYGLIKLKDEEEMAKSAIEILSDQGLNERGLTELKEKMKLEIQEKYAEKRLDALLRANGLEEKITKANMSQLLSNDNIKNAVAKGVDIFDFLGIKITDDKAKAEIIKAIEQVRSAGNQNQPENQKSLFEVLGFSNEQGQNITDGLKAFSAAASEISNALGALASLYDEQIEKRKANIESLQEEIDAQTDKVSTEKELMDEGYANNYDIEQKRLEDLKTSQETERKLMEDVNKKKQQLQKAQMIADSAAQLSNMILAVTEIFSAHASAPFVGTAFAIAAIAAMFVAFAAAKVSAYKAINKQSAESGRRVAAGNRHSAGGNKYQSIDGNDPDILEIEEGEWVVNRKSSKKYDPILEAINNDELSGMSRHELSTMLKPIGIHLQDDLPKKVVEQYHASATSATKVVVVNNDDSRQWEKQNQILEKIADKGKQVTYHDGYRIEKEGNFIRKIFDKPNDN